MKQKFYDWMPFLMATSRYHLLALSLLCLLWILNVKGLCFLTYHKQLKKSVLLMCGDGSFCIYWDLLACGWLASFSVWQYAWPVCLHASFPTVCGTRNFVGFLFLLHFGGFQLLVSAKFTCICNSCSVIIVLFCVQQKWNESECIYSNLCILPPYQGSYDAFLIDFGM